MRAIHKQLLNVDDFQRITVPKGATFLTAQTVKHDMIAVWYLCDPSLKEFEERELVVFGTGHPVPEGELSYIGTVQIRDGNLVFHVFENKGVKR